MKIDVNQLTQDKKNLVIVVAALAAVLLIAVLFSVLRGNGGDTASAPTTGNNPAEMANAPGGMPGEMPPGGAPGPDAAAPGPAGAPGVPGEMPPGGGPAGASPAGSEGTPAGGSDGTTIPKGLPVEPFRQDPFVGKPPVKAPPRMPVLPPIVVAMEPPQPMVVPPTVNIIPASIVSDSKAVAQEIQRRLSGVLWNGSVVAILETPTDPQHKSVILRPGDPVSDTLRVQSITRDKMVLVDDSSAGHRRQIEVALKPAPRGAAMGLAPGMSGMSGMPGGPAGAPGNMPGPMGP